MTNDAPQVLFRGRFLSLVKDGRWEYAARINAQGAVVIVPFKSDGTLVMVEQVRVPLGKPSIEFPAGLIGDEPGTTDEDVRAAAHRELIEETGYQAHRMEFLATCPTSPGLTSEEITYLAALDLERVGEGGGDEREQIIVHEVRPAALDAWLAEQLARGASISGTTYTALWLARNLLTGANRPSV